MDWAQYLQRYKVIVVQTDPEAHARLMDMRQRWTKKLTPADPSVVIAKYINPMHIRKQYGYWHFRFCDQLTQRKMMVPFAEFSQYQLDEIHGTYQDQTVINARDTKFQNIFNNNSFFFMHMINLQSQCEQRQYIQVGWEESRRRYQEYLTHPLSPWQNLRAQVKARDKVCTACGQKSGIMNVHHITYARIGNESLEDLRLLCRACHREEHGKSS
jgi:hypothetical protein